MSLPFELRPSPWHSAFVVLFFCVTLVAGTPKLLRLKQFTNSAARLSSFRSAIGLCWSYALLALVLAMPNDLLVVRNPEADMAWLLDKGGTRTAAIVLSIAYFCLAFVPALRCALRPVARREYRAAMVPLQFLLPVSKRERRWWVLLSITVGVCEEVFFRGFVQQFLQGQLGGGWNLSLTNAWLLSSLAFGSCHVYQGAAGVLRTTLAGLMFGLLAILSGNLLLPIVLHALIDLSVLSMYHPQRDNPDAAARLMQGCAPTI
jgi:membrane protease YdiL (CAAX protease family)